MSKGNYSFYKSLIKELRSDEKIKNNIIFLQYTQDIDNFINEVGGCFIYDIIELPPKIQTKLDYLSSLRNTIIPKNEEKFYTLLKEHSKCNECDCPCQKINQYISTIGLHDFIQQKDNNTLPETIKQAIYIFYEYLIEPEIFD